MKSLVAGMCIAAALSCAAAYSRMTVDASALPETQGNALREAVLARVWARTPPSDAADCLNVRFVLDESLDGETASVAVSGGSAVVRGARMRSLVFGAGVLLRAIRYGEREFSIEDGEYAFSPAKKYRIAYLARHFRSEERL